MQIYSWQYHTWQRGMKHCKHERLCVKGFGVLICKHRDAQPHKDEIQVEYTAHDLQREKKKERDCTCCSNS